MMKTQPEKKGVKKDHSTSTKKQRTVSRHEGFHFFRGPGESTGKVATTLSEFSKHIGTIDVRAINFHFHRRDFEKWIRDTLEESILATRLAKIRKETHGEQLRTQINQLVKRRLDDLTI